MIPGKLKPNAIPTLFDYNSPKLHRISRKRKYTLDGNSSQVKKRLHESDESSQEASTESTPITKDSSGIIRKSSTKTPRVKKILSSQDDCSGTPLTSVDPQDVDNSKKCLNSSHQIKPKSKKSTPTSVRLGRYMKRKSAASSQTAKKKIQVSDNYLGSFLNPLQMKALNFSAVTWSEAAIKKALQLRFSCGYHGYNVLREQGLPLPTDETLRRKLEAVPFKNGLTNEIFQTLQLRVQSMDEHEKIVSLVMNEISIQPCLEWDERAECVVGLPTLPKSRGDPAEQDFEISSLAKESEPDLDEDCNGFEYLARSAVIFMLKGVASSWKQIIAYELIGNTFHSTVMKDIIMNVISSCHVIGLDVRNVTMDLASGGQAVLRHFGITHGRIGDITNIVPHPVVARNKLQFFASFPHLLKSLRNLLSSGEEIFLPDTIVLKYNLPTCVVNLTHIQMMINLDEQHGLRLAPHLKYEYLKPRHFDKLNVQPAQRLFSQETAMALRFLVKQKLIVEDALSTAWFFEQIAAWYEIVTSKSPTMDNSRFSIEKVNGTVKKLNDFTSLILNMNIGRKNAARKRLQKEMYISTSAVLMVKNDYLNAGDSIEGYNQNCLENLFSLVRFDNTVPTALEFKNALRIFSLFQLLKGCCRQNCVVDSSVHLPQTLLHHLDGTEAKEVACVKYKSTKLQITKLEEHTLYNMCVYCVTHFVRFNMNCDRCVNFLVARGKPSISSLAPEKCYSPDTHTYACIHVYHFLEIAEKTVLDLSESVIKGDIVVPRLTERIMLRSQQIEFPSCHQIKEKILKWYLGARIYSFLKEKVDVYV